MPGQRLVAEAGLQIFPQSNGKALLVYEKALAGGFQKMDRHSFGLAQVLAVGHGFVCFIGNIGLKIFPVNLGHANPLLLVNRTVHQINI